MCGIAGVISNVESVPVERGETLGAMMARLAHRGPDGSGSFRAPGIELGHRRLAILDLSSAGAQPMQSRDGRFRITLNGEIFNYRELRAELGGEFRSASDTEVLLEACASWGLERTLEASNGMFAFALWDAQERELTLARDRSGEKPLVYFWDGETFAFASELKALRGLHSGRLDPDAVDAYLALGYIPAPLAAFRDCHKLPPGHLLRFRSGRIEVRRWWLPEATRPLLANAAPPLLATPEDSCGRLRWLLGDAVRLRLHADVPVALALSGGVDSSVIAAECVEAGAQPDAYTVVFDGPASNENGSELPYAELAARHYGLRHHVVHAAADAAEQQFQAALWRYDEPFADSSAIPALALARAIASSGIHKVVLTGDGGDEAFGGYRHYQHIAAKQMLKAAAARAGIRDGSGATGVYVESKSIFGRRERERLLEGRSSGGAVARLLSADDFLGKAKGDALHRALWCDRHLSLPNDLTFKMDIALAAFGREGRAPFLDHRVLEWAQGLPSRQLVRGGAKKILLRRAYRGRVPDALLDREKRGFGSPVEAWLAGPLAALIRDSLPCRLLDIQAQQGSAGKRGSAQRLWTLAVFAGWAEIWRARW